MYSFGTVLAFSATEAGGLERDTMQRFAKAALAGYAAASDNLELCVSSLLKAEAQLTPEKIRTAILKIVSLNARSQAIVENIDRWLEIPETTRERVRKMYWLPPN